MADILEGTPEFNRGHSLVTGPVPIVTVSDSEKLDMFSDDTPIEAQCDLENPESCESCQ